MSLGLAPITAVFMVSPGCVLMGRCSLGAPPEDATSIYAAGRARRTPSSKVVGCGGLGSSLIPQGLFVGGLVLETNTDKPKTAPNKTKQNPQNKMPEKKALHSRGTHLLVSFWL